MIFEWSANPYYDGISHAFVPPVEIEPPPLAGFTLIYDPFTFVWVQGGGTAQPPGDAAGFTLIYDGFTFVWVQFAIPREGASTWLASGAGGAQFLANEREIWFIAAGTGGSDWFLLGDAVSGFLADGTGGTEFFASGNPLLMNGTGGAEFEAETGLYLGFPAYGAGGARFKTSAGVNENCLTPGVAPAGAIPNYVY